MPRKENMPSEWKSWWSYDPEAERILIDNNYVAFVRYSTDHLSLTVPGMTNGNVITLHPGLKNHPVIGFHESVLQHEMQHVIQSMDIEEFGKKYEMDPLFYELEACARQIINAPFDDPTIRQTMINNLVSKGMDKTDVERWMSNVNTTRAYPGVTSPRLEGN